MEKESGFTLIELLVVIAVIAILASVVISSATASRYRGMNSAIIANMRTISQQVELQYLNVYQGSYGTVAHARGSCSTNTAGDIFSDATIQKVVVELQKLSGTVPTCASTLRQWAVSVPLKTPQNGRGYWCIETEGKAKAEVAGITGTFCL